MGRPKRLGQSKYDYLSDEETEHIVRWLKLGKTTPEIAAVSGRTEEQIADIRAAFFPTVGLAKAYLRSNALRLAKRVVEEANVDEALSVLTRGNIGVLDPLVKGGQAGGPTAILTSINTSHLGGVQVAVMTGTPGAQEALPDGSGDDDERWSSPFEGIHRNAPPPQGHRPVFATGGQRAAQPRAALPASAGRDGDPADVERPAPSPHARPAPQRHARPAARAGRPHASRSPKSDGQHGRRQRIAPAPTRSSPPRSPSPKQRKRR